MNDPVGFLNNLFKAALEAADPLKTVPPHLPKPPKGRTIVVGAGKAAAAMACAVDKHWPADRPLDGVVVTRYGYGMKSGRIDVIEAAHPVPDNAGEVAAGRILKAVEGLGSDDLVIFLISGGGSSLLSMPAPCLTSDEKRAINKALLKSGAPIHEMNCVRKHLSAIKGGRLALAAAPASVLTLVVSDVPGDDPRVVASGPTLPDPTTQQEALAILDKYAIPVSDKVRAYLSDASNETPKPGDPRFAGHRSVVVSKAQDSLMAGAQFAAAAGVEPFLLGDDLQGEARVVGEAQAQEAFRYLNKSPCVLISGGETTVTVKGNGRGGRNAEYLLAAAIASLGDHRIYGLACDTDGIDGSEDNAGAIFTPQTLGEAKAKGLDGAQFLANNDAYSFFKVLDRLVITGPTFTNVNDFRAILVL